MRCPTQQLDMLGTNQQNVTTNVEKWQIDEGGKRRMYQGRNRRQPELESDHEEHPELHVLHENGVHAEDLVAGGWDEYMANNDLVFVDFFAPWCIWCQRLAPTWEKFAEDVEEAALPVAVAKVTNRWHGACPLIAGSWQPCAARLPTRAANACDQP